MINVARGKKLPFTQEQVGTPKGWAFESRVYAEDPEKYLPSIGTLSKYIEPVGPPNEVRCDSGIVEGSEISIYYDPMICKLCTYGPTREESRKRMEKALDEYVIKGVTHNIPLLRDVVSHPRFISGKLSTNFLPEEYPKGFKGHVLTEEDKKKLFAIGAVMFAKKDVRNRTWIQGGGSLADKSTGELKTSWELTVGVKDDVKPVVVTRVGDKYSVTIAGEKIDVGLDWKLEAPIVRAKLTNVPEPVVLQYLDSIPLGYRIQYLGTKVHYHSN
jgi:propionyl-CoA carboxylase alpha chain